MHSYIYFPGSPEKLLSLKGRTPMKTNKNVVIKALVAGLLLINSACSGSSGQLANVSLRLSDSNAVTTHNLMSLFFPKAKAAEYGDILFCLERLRFELPEGIVTQITSQDDDSTEEEIEDSIDFEIGEVVIDPQGTDLGNIQVPVGTYSEIEFDLDNDCLSGKSIQITNASGSFSTDEEVTIKFEGEFVVSEGVQIVLPLAEIVAAIDSFNPSSQNQEIIDEELEELMESLSIRTEDND